MAVLASADAIAALRRPKVIFTDAYLNDPIQFETDGRFIPQTAISQDNTIELIERDTTDFAIVTLNVEKPQIYSLDMFKVVYNRADVIRTIDKKFRQLVSDNA